MRGSAPQEKKHTHALHKDALIGIYFWLWKYKDRLSNRTLLPFAETIVYEHHFPRGWYTYVDGAMVKKTAKDCDTSSIFDAFTKGARVDVVANFLWRDDNNPDLHVRYMNRRDLYAFLTKPMEKGLLQRFVPPNSTYNDNMQVTWTPFVFFAERWQNVNLLSDTRMSLEQKTAAEANSVNCHEVCCAPHTVQDIKAWCHSFVNDFARLEKREVKAMQLKFKLDAHQTLVLLQSTQMFVSDTSLIHPMKFFESAAGSTPRGSASGITSLNASVQVAPPTVGIQLNDPKTLQRLRLGALRNAPVSRVRRAGELSDRLLQRKGSSATITARDHVVTTVPDSWEPASSTSSSEEDVLSDKGSDGSETSSTRKKGEIGTIITPQMAMGGAGFYVPRTRHPGLTIAGGTQNRVNVASLPVLNPSDPHSRKSITSMVSPRSGRGSSLHLKSGKGTRTAKKGPLPQLSATARPESALALGRGRGKKKRPTVSTVMGKSGSPVGKPDISEQYLALLRTVESHGGGTAGKAGHAHSRGELDGFNGLPTAPPPEPNHMKKPRRSGAYRTVRHEFNNRRRKAGASASLMRLAADMGIPMHVHHVEMVHKARERPTASDADDCGVDEGATDDEDGDNKLSASDAAWRVELQRREETFREFWKDAAYDAYQHCLSHAKGPFVVNFPPDVSPAYLPDVLHRLEVPALSSFAYELLPDSTTTGRLAILKLIIDGVQESISDLFSRELPLSPRWGLVDEEGVEGDASSGGDVSDIAFWELFGAESTHDVPEVVHVG